MSRFRRLLLCLAACALLGNSGCAELRHELQPHRLWRLNRGPAPRSDAFFSIEDPLAEQLLERSNS